MKLTIEVPTAVHDEIEQLQHRVLAYEISKEDARALMLDLIAPYTSYIPGENDQTEIIRQRPTISIPKKGLVHV